LAGRRAAGQFQREYTAGDGLNHRPGLAQG
jgi:hypothetical protein